MYRYLHEIVEHGCAAFIFAKNQRLDILSSQADHKSMKRS